MKANIKFNDKCECFFDAEIPTADVEKTLKEVYRDIAKVAKIPGYRPGNAPQDLLEKYHSNDARDETLKRLIPEGCRRILEEKKINAISVPEVFDVIFEKGKNLTFKGRVEVRPDIKLKNYKLIKVKKPKIEIKEQEIDDVIKRLREMNANFTVVTESRPIKKGDFIVCDLEAFIDDRPITKKYENMLIEADKDASLLGVGEHLIGASTKENKEIDIKLPDDYPDKKFAGKNANFKVSIKEIKEKRLPELNDEFAKDIGAQSFDNLKENLRKDLAARKEADAKIDMENQILNKLLDDYKVSVPPSMEKRQYEIMVKHLEEELHMRGVPKEAIDEKKKEFDSKMKNDAQDKVRVYFILSAIAQAENVKVDPGDLDAKYEEIAAQSRQSAETVKKYYEKNDFVDGLLEQIREEKTLEWLLSQAEVTNI